MFKESEYKLKFFWRFSCVDLHNISQNYVEGLDKEIDCFDRSIWLELRQIRVRKAPE